MKQFQEELTQFLSVTSHETQFKQDIYYVKLCIIKVKDT